MLKYEQKIKWRILILRLVELPDLNMKYVTKTSDNTLIYKDKQFFLVKESCSQRR